jgi:hypothetical protein
MQMADMPIASCRLSTVTGASTRTLQAELLENASRDDYHHWLSTAKAARGCVRPIRLRGRD